VRTVNNTMLLWQLLDASRDAFYPLA